MTSILSDIRFALRLVRRSPGFYATLLAVLVAGIGATTAMFSIVESLLLRPLPYPHSEDITVFWRTIPHIGQVGANSIPDFVDWKEQATSFERMTLVRGSAFSLSSEGSAPENVRGANVSGDFFPMFQVEPLAGRLLGPDDDHLGGSRVAVISSSLWHRRFGSDPSVVGKAVILDSEAYTVVGVAPEGFRVSGPNSANCEVWTPIAVSLPLYAENLHQRGNHFATVMGRLKPGVSLSRAQAQISSIARTLEVAHPDTNTKNVITLESLHDAMVGDARAGAWILFGAVFLVFSIVCSNVANLLLTRAQTRRSEMALRAALGAAPSRLLWQILTETVVIFLLGAVGGAIAARGLVSLFARGVVGLGRGGAATIVMGVDWIALAFSIGICVCCGLVYGLVPALMASHVEPQAVLKEDAARASSGRSQRSVRGALVVAQVALACALLVGSGLALRAFGRLSSTPPGFDPKGVATANISLPTVKYADPDRVRAFFRDVLAKVAAQPGVSAVGINSSLPMGGDNWSSSYQIEGRPPAPAGEDPDIERNVVTPGYFKAMGISLLRGRNLQETDDKDSRKVVVINASMAAHSFPGEDAIGHRISVDSGDDDKPIWLEIVGIVGDVHQKALTEPIADASYVPIAQLAYPDSFVTARTSSPEALLQALPGIVASVDPQQAVADRMTMDERIADTVNGQRQVAIVLASFAGAALVLACIGVFGLVSYTTRQRQREIGIRMALGSTPAAALGLAMQSGLRLVGIGLGLGIVSAVFVGRILATRMEGVTAFDLPAYASIVVILGLAGTVACLLPALRAVRIPPASALRYE